MFYILAIIFDIDAYDWKEFITSTTTVDESNGANFSVMGAAVIDILTIRKGKTLAWYFNAVFVAIFDIKWSFFTAYVVCCISITTTLTTDIISSNAANKNVSACVN